MVLLPLAASSRTVPARLHQHHQFALLVGVRCSSSFRPEVNSFVNSLQKKKYRKQQQEIQTREFSNFTKMLQLYQDLPRNRRRDGRKTRGADSNFTRRHDADAHQRHDAIPKTSPIVTANTKSNSQAKSHNENAYKEDRPRWRSRNNSAESSVIVNATSLRNVATSEWLHIYNTPLMSKLSDLFPCLNQIINYELAKGIIDLDTVLHDPRYFDSHLRVAALEKVGATLDTLYPTSQIINDDDNSSENIPLWSPREEYTTINPSSLYDICPMILEARVQLSYRALPVGWFVRLPSRSVVHAVINHIRRAEQDKWASSNDDKILKQHRKEWREGLWKGVYAEYEYAAGKKEMMLSVQQEGRDEKELMWGDKWDEESTDELLLENATEGGDGNQTLPLEASEKNADDYIQRYSQSHPYSPSQSMDQVTRQASPYHLMKSGSKILSVREFSPHPPNISSSSKENLPWEQHAFSLSPHLKLSDSVVRVETSDLTATEEDIQYFFRGYDLMGIKEETKQDVYFDAFTTYTRSIGWNITSTGIVDLLTVEGKHTDRKHGTQRVFLVHFASSAEARMAIRDKDGKLEEGFGWSLTAYPNVTVHIST
jgi:hypothetical protein